MFFHNQQVFTDVNDRYFIATQQRKTTYFGLFKSRFVLVRTHANGTLTGVVIHPQRSRTSGGNGIRFVIHRQVIISIDRWIVN